MPAANTGVLRREPIMTRIKEVRQHAPKIEINKSRPLIEQEFTRPQHLLEWKQLFRQLFLQFGLLRFPLFQAAAAEFALLVAKVVQALSRRHKLFIMRIIQPESKAFDLVLNKPPEDMLHPVPIAREQAQRKLRIEVFGDDLRILSGFE